MNTQVDQKRVTWQDFEVAPEKRPWEEHDCLSMEELDETILPPYQELMPLDWITELKIFDITRYAEFLRDWKETSQGVFEGIYTPPSVGYDVASGKSFTAIREIRGYSLCSPYRNSITNWTP